MPIYKIGSSIKLLKIAEVVHDVTPKVTPPVTPNVKPNVTKVPEKGTANYSGDVVEPLDKKNFLYFKARAISAGETSGPNGNGDYFPLEELVKSYGTFKGRGLFLNHDSADVSKAVGKVIDAYLIVDQDTKDIWVECLCKVDRMLNPHIARQLEGGLIDSVSMGCTCDTAICSVCNKEMHRKEDFCEHMTGGLLRDFDVDGKNIRCYSINKGITFTELSLVSVPADGKAKIHELIASLKTNNSAESKDVVEGVMKIYASLSAEDKNLVKNEIEALMADKKTAGVENETDTQEFRRSDNMEKEAGKTDPKQPACDIETTKQEQDCGKDLKEVSGLEKEYEKVKTTKQEQDGVRNVLNKMNALDYLQLMEHFKKESSEKDLKNIERFNDKDYEKGTHGRAQEIANETKKTKVEEPKLKDMKNDMMARTAAEKKEAGKHGVDYGDEVPAPKNEAEIDKIRKTILERVSEKMTSKLFATSVLKEITNIIGDETKAKKAFMKLFPGMMKSAAAKSGGKENYYWTGAKEPKAVSNFGTDEAGMYASEFQGVDVTSIPEGKTSADYEKQVAEGRKESKDAWDKDRETVRKDVEKGNGVEKSKGKLGFKASLEKKAELGDSTWSITDKEGKIVFTASLNQIWGEALPESKEFAVSNVYGDYLVRKAEKGEGGLEDLFKKIKSTPKAEKKDEAKGDEPNADKEPKADPMKMDKEPAPMAAPGAEKAEGADEKEAPSEKALNKLEDLWSAAKMEGKLPTRKSDVPVYEHICNVLDKVIDNLGGSKDKKEDAKKDAAPESEPKEKKEDKKGKADEKSGGEKSPEPSENERKLQAELMAERAKASLREKVIRCRATIENMLERDMIEPDEKVVETTQKEGLGPIEARNRGLKSAIDNKMAEMLRMDETSFAAFNKLVAGMKKEASMDVLKTVPNMTREDVSIDEWFKNLPWS